MRSSDSPRSPVTRRAILGSTAAIAAGIGSTPGAAAAPQSRAATPTVMTQNAYVGFDVAELSRASSRADIRRIAAGFREGIDPEVYAARADTIAASVAAAGADVVALQEAVTLRRQRPGDFGTGSSEAAAEVVVDILDAILAALDRRGLDYTVAAETVPSDFELPAGSEDSPVDLRITDRTALLVRDDLDTADPATGTFDAALRLPVPGSDRRLTVRRGYCGADVTVDGVSFRAVSTHLESTSARYRRRQARELLDVLPAGPVVVGGDLNSAPGDEAYDVLTGSLTDSYAELRPDVDAYTCCQAKDLRNDRSRLSRRIDTLLYRGAVTPTAIGRVGHRPGDRAVVERGGETVRVWPSDHAGVVGTFDISSPASATATPSTTPQAGTATGTSGPGFGVLSAVAGLALGAGAWLGQRGE